MLMPLLLGRRAGRACCSTQTQCSSWFLLAPTQPLPTALPCPPLRVQCWQPDTSTLQHSRDGDVKFVQVRCTLQCCLVHGTLPCLVQQASLVPRPPDPSYSSKLLAHPLSRPQHIPRSWR